MLDIQNLNQFYGESHTLWDLSMEIPKGSCICLMGRNGVGKTTLLKSIMGLEKVRSGDIVFDGNNITNRLAEVRGSDPGHSERLAPKSQAGSSLFTTLRLP